MDPDSKKHGDFVQNAVKPKKARRMKMGKKSASLQGKGLDFVQTVER